MVKFQKYFRKSLALAFFLLLTTSIWAQINCNYYLFEGDTLRYKACEESNLVMNSGFYQFSREFQEGFDRVLEIDPQYAYAWREKSVAYLKSGDFLTWKKLIDKAVEYDLVKNLGYRAWCRYQFFEDYQGAIDDIEKLETECSFDLGTGANGDYHLIMTKAICYSALGDKLKAIHIMKSLLESTDYFIGLYDYYQLGVTYFQVSDYDRAMECFRKQNEVSAMAENAYYMAKINKMRGNEIDYLYNKKLSLDLYQNQKNMYDPYTHHFNKIYYQQIQEL